MSNPALDELAAQRVAIDRIDRAIVRLLGERRAVVAKLRALKTEHDLPRHDPAREASLRLALHAEARVHDVPSALVDAVLDAILDDSRALVGASDAEG